jgi:uncharacterized protein
MADLLSLALANLLSPPVLFFALGIAAGFARSDLAIPEQVAKGLSLYLLLAIGYKGGAAAAANGLDAAFLAAIGLGLVLSCLMPLVAFAFLRGAKSIDRVTAAATAAHYGSISIVTFVAAMDFAANAGLAPGSYLAAVAAIMETPGIIVALMLAGVSAATPQSPAKGHKGGFSAELLREVLLNGSVVVLVGAFAIGVITGERHMERLSVFMTGLFAGVLCLFLLEMGLVAARRLQGRNRLTPYLVLCGLLIPVCGASLGLAGALALQMPPGDAMILMTLAASGSYIAAPAAMRIALPEADAGVYLPLAIGVSFPFNIVIGIPLYAGIAEALL